MSKNVEQYNPDGECENCLPIIINVKTGKVMTPEEFPPLKIMIDIYRKLTLEEKHAWHRVTCEHSRASSDLTLVQPFIEEIQTVVKKADSDG